MLPASAHAAAPSIDIGPIDCDAGGSWATVVNPSVPLRFEVGRDGNVLSDQVLEPATEAVRTLVPIEEGASATVTVRYGSSYVSKALRRACDPATPTAPSSSASASTASGAPYVASNAAAVTRDTPGATPVPPSQAAPSNASKITVDDGIAPQWLLVAGALLLAGIAAVSVARVSRSRRDEPSRGPAARPRA